MSEELPYKLWERWFDERGDPWQGDDGYGASFCVFCLGDYPNHEPDCIYVRAAELLGRELVT